MDSPRLESEEAVATPPTAAEQQEELLLASVQSILLRREREQIQELEGHLTQLQARFQARLEGLQTRTGELEAELQATRNALRQAEENAHGLEIVVEMLQNRAQTDSEGFSGHPIHYFHSAYSRGFGNQ